MKKPVLNEEEKEHEILKAVAQAWIGSSRPTDEFNAYRSNHKNKATRFKLEAMNKSSKDIAGLSWDFRESLWDSYEIVSVSKKLEAGMVLDHPMSLSGEQNKLHTKKPRESKNSLRNLFSSSKK